MILYFNYINLYFYFNFLYYQHNLILMYISLRLCDISKEDIETQTHFQRECLEAVYNL